MFWIFTPTISKFESIIENVIVKKILFHKYDVVSTNILPIVFIWTWLKTKHWKLRTLIWSAHVVAANPWRNLSKPNWTLTGFNSNKSHICPSSSSSSSSIQTHSHISILIYFCLTLCRSWILMAPKLQGPMILKMTPQIQYWVSKKSNFSFRVLLVCCMRITQLPLCWSLSFFFNHLFWQGNVKRG